MLGTPNVLCDGNLCEFLDIPIRIDVQFEREVSTSVRGASNAVCDSVATIATDISAIESFSFPGESACINSIRKGLEIIAVQNIHHTETDLSSGRNPGGIPSMYQVAKFPEVVQHFQCISSRRRGQEPYYRTEIAI